MHTKSRLIPAVFAALILAGCGGPEPAHTVSPVQTATAGRPEAAMPSPTLPLTPYPPPTSYQPPVPYVPPPPTPAPATPKPTATPQPTPTAWDERTGQVAPGTGFPRLPVVAPGSDGITLALYVVEDDTATQLVQYDGLDWGSDSVIVRLSPDGKHIAALLLDSWDGASTLEVVDVATADRLTLDRGAGYLAPEKGAAHDSITSLAWLDDEHLLYSKVTSPSSAEWEASWEAGVPPPIQGEIWLSDVDATERHPLASGRIHRVLGASPDGQTLYVTRLIPGREENREEGFALVDVASGEMKNLWPPEERGAERYHNFKQVTLPDGTQRWLFATAERGDTAPGQPPVIWMADVEGGQAEAIWTIDRGNDWSKGEMTGTVYDIPHDFLWSPDSAREFVYLGDTLAPGGVWRVDLDAGTAEPLPAMEAVKTTRLRLLAWTAEGIVVQNEDTLWLLDEGGEVQGEIRFRAETALVSAFVVGPPPSSRPHSVKVGERCTQRVV